MKANIQIPKGSFKIKSGAKIQWQDAILRCDSLSNLTWESVAIETIGTPTTKNEIVIRKHK